MKYLPLIWRNFLRRKTRTALTFLSIVVTFLLFGILMMLRVAFSGGVEMAGADRLMMTNKVSLIQPLLLSYYERINATPGVDYATYSSWFGGIYQDPKNGVFEFAVQPETYLRMYPEFKLPADQLKAWLADKQGVIVGSDLAKKFGWKIGDKIPIQGTFNRPRGGDGITWEFNLAGIYTGDEKTDKTQFLLRHDYLTESRRGSDAEGITGWYLIKVKDPYQSADIAHALDKQFENSDFETKTATEKAVAQGFANQVGNIGAIVTRIAAVVLFIILLIAASQMSLAVRERTNEIGAMKAIGYPDGLVLGLILAESVTLAAVAGFIGLGLAWVFGSFAAPTGGFLPVFYLPPADLALGAALAISLGLVAGAMPAWAAMRLKITDALRKT
jgi:putative ABC transport system permease protein